MKSRLLLAFFALPFAGTGTWMGWSLAHMVTDAIAMRSWLPVDATIQDGGYTSHSDDDATTYEAWGHYRYEVDGHSYTADRVQLTGGADNIGDFQQDLGRRLENAAWAGTTLTAWVDPDDHSNAVLDRTLRWGLVGFKSVFFLVFGGIGFGLLIGAARSTSEPDATLPEYRETPWRLNPGWQNASIRSGSRSAMWGAWLFAVLWNLISAPLPFLLYREVVGKGNWPALVGLLFPLVGIGLLVWAIRRTLEWWRFGATPVELDPFPGSIGGHVGGTIDTRLPFDPGTRFEVTLTNAHSYMSGSGDDRSRRERVLWQDQILAHAAAGPQGTRLSFRFDVPDNLAESIARPSGDAHDLWRLNLKASLPGTDLSRDFEIPVYRTARRSALIGSDRAGAPRSVQSAHYGDAARRRFRLESTPMGKTLVVPMGQYLLGNTAGLFVGGAFAAAGWFLAVHEGHRVFGAIFGGVSALVAVSAVYVLFRSLHVRLDGDRITSQRRWMGIPIRSRSMRRGEFARFATKSNMQVNSGTESTRYFNISAVDRMGNSLLLAENFRGEAETRAAVGILESEFGLREDRARTRFELDRSLFDEGRPSKA